MIGRVIGGVIGGEGGGGNSLGPTWALLSSTQNQSSDMVKKGKGKRANNSGKM